MVSLRNPPTLKFNLMILNELHAAFHRVWLCAFTVTASRIFLKMPVTMMSHTCHADSDIGVPVLRSLSVFSLPTTMDVVENPQAGGVNVGQTHFAPQKVAMPYSCAGASQGVHC